MADKYAGGIRAGATDVELSVLLRQTGNSIEKTGVAFASATVYYRRAGGLPVAVTLKAGTAADAAHDDGAWLELDATNQAGVYRVDVPDAAFAAGAAFVMVSVSVAGCFVFHREFALSDPANDALPASPVAGTFGDALAAAWHVAKGKTEVVEVASQWKFRVYKADDDTTVWREWDIDHPNSPSTKEPV